MDTNRLMNLEEKILSRINSYSLIMSLASPEDSQTIEDARIKHTQALKYPDYEGIKAVISLIKAYALLYDAGVFPPETKNQTAELVAYLISLIPPKRETGTIRKRNISTLGASFIRNGFGIPLFGPMRPSSPPQKGGVILNWSSYGKDDLILITAAQLTGKTQLHYRNLGIQMESQTRWVLMQLKKNTKEPVFQPKEAWLSEAEHYSFNRYKLSLSSKPEICQEMSSVFDPLENQYVYYFLPEENLRLKMLKYLSRTLSGSFGIPLRESEKTAQAFIQKLH
ncbi:hypothetical protein EXM22_11000 [Oceanispirochaeta crateris]|uniref:Uncharacterized protein n=1 Tax=Oceanispirochaeta crateris TaxID=2518645 RepID=A0A5C1QMD6_9SPIO|nr:hypothetical protein [Oceanispirochaeta crateris]QEN08488.1 hypothetical protein EXM22_11000 [Oceanispirochaeta crateris]